MQTKRVLFIDQSGQLGGAELFLKDLAIAFAGHSEVVLFQDGPFREMLVGQGVKVTVIPLGLGARGFGKSSGIGSALIALPGFMRAVAQIAKLARSFDVIYANTAKAAIVAAPAAHIAGVRLVVHLHDIISARHFGKLGRFALVRAANQASLIIANSEATRDAFVDASSHVPPIEVVPNGFDPDDFIPPLPDQLITIRAALGVGDSFTVGVFGRISEWKGQHVLLEAMRALPDVHCVIVGDALFTSRDKNYADRLRCLAGDRKIAERVHFTGFRSDVPLLMHAMDAIVHTSVAPEPFGRVIVEAMLCGKPVVATIPGGPEEIVEAGVTGLLVPAENPEALAKAIAFLQSNPEQAAEIGRKAQAAARGKYGIKKIVEAVKRALDEIDTSS